MHEMHTSFGMISTKNIARVIKTNDNDADVNEQCYGGLRV